jgi:hypothetical protein
MTWILLMPARMGMLPRMRTELVLWAIGLLSGMGTYCAWYVASFR